MTKIEHEFSTSALFARTVEFNRKDPKIDNIERDSYERDEFFSEDQEAEFQRLSLDSGFGPDGEDDDEDDKEEESGNEFSSDRDKSELKSYEEDCQEEETTRKLQSILKTKPQVFVIRSDKKVRKKPLKGKTTQETHPQRKSVEFLLPDGVRIPERGPVRKKPKSRIHFPIRRARRTLGHLKSKITGKNYSGIPLLPSVHSSHTHRQNQKKKHLKPKTSSPVFPRRTTIKFGKGRKKGGKTGGDSKKSAEEEEDELSQITNPLVLGRVLVSKDEEEDANGTHKEEEEEDHDAVQETEEEEEEALNEEDRNKKTECQEEEEDDYPKISRRKALGYHIRRINLQQQQQKKKYNKKPTFPTAGHGVGHAHHSYPKPCDPSVEDCGKTKSKKKSLPFKTKNKNKIEKNSQPGSNFLPKEEKVDSTSGSNSDKIVSESTNDTGQPQPEQQQQQSSGLLLDFNQKLVEIRSRILNPSEYRAMPRRFSTPQSSAKPGRIINTRYRRDPPKDGESFHFEF